MKRIAYIAKRPPSRKSSRCLSVLLVLAALIAAIAAACYMPIGSHEFGSGDDRVDREEAAAPGTPGNPYLINTADALVALLQGDNVSLSSYYELTADIDLDGVSWTPIAPGPGEEFTGRLDGKGHSIRNFTIAMTGEEEWGFFSVIGEGGRVRNLGLEGAGLEGEDEPAKVGILAGVNKGTIEKSFVTGTIIEAEDRTGGLVGSNSGTIRYCYARVFELTGNNRVGGLVGENTAGGLVTETYAASSITAEPAFKGGLVGRNDSGAEVHRSFFDQSLEPDLDPIGADFGVADEVHGLSTNDAQDAGVLTGEALGLFFDFETIWALDGGCNEDYPYLIDNAPSSCGG